MSPTGLWASSLFRSDCLPRMALMSRHQGILPYFLLLALLLIPMGCRQDVPPSALPNNGSPMVRVRLVENRDTVKLAASSPPKVSTGADRPQSFNIPVAVDVTLTPGGWRIGNQTLGTGELIVEPN